MLSDLSSTVAVITAVPVLRAVAVTCEPSDALREITVSSLTVHVTFSDEFYQVDKNLDV